MSNKFLYYVGRPMKNSTEDPFSKISLFVQNEAGQSILPRECTVHSKHPLPTTQDKTLHVDITRW